MSQNETTIDIPAYFHTILFAYQTRLKQILGSGEAVFVQPVLATIGKIDAEKGLSTIRGSTPAEILENFAKDLTASKVVEKAWLEQTGFDEFVFHVDGCVFAAHTHDVLKPRDVVCPLALIAMSIFQGATGKKVTVTESEFTPDGSKTVIE